MDAWELEEATTEQWGLEEGADVWTIEEAPLATPVKTDPMRPLIAQ